MCQLLFCKIIKLLVEGVTELQNVAVIIIGSYFKTMNVELFLATVKPLLIKFLTRV